MWKLKGSLGVGADVEAKFPLTTEETRTPQLPPPPHQTKTPLNTVEKGHERLRQDAGLLWEKKKEQSYSEVTTVYKRCIVLLHGNCFHRNLCSETLLFGRHITASSRKMG